MATGNLVRWWYWDSLLDIDDNGNVLVVGKAGILGGEDRVLISAQLPVTSTVI
jgi:hypothetical protein